MRFHKTEDILGLSAENRPAESMRFRKIEEVLAKLAKDQHSCSTDERIVVALEKMADNWR